MRRLALLGLRARLAVAMIALAVFAVGLATVFSNQGLTPRLSAAAQARMTRSAAALAAIAADDYRHHRGWTRPDLDSLERLAAGTGLAITVSTSTGQALVSSPPATSRGASPPARVTVFVHGQAVGSIRVSSSGSTTLSPEEVGLRHSLDTLHLFAAVLSVAAALVVAFVLAQTLSTPLRRARQAAEAISRGDLKTRVSPGGGAEVAALGDALNQLAQTLEHEETLRKATVADLAHELRTPVGGLLSRIEAAQDHVLPDEAANLEAMHAEATRLTALLNDLSRLADAERPGILLDKQRLDLAKSAADQIKAFRPRFEAKSIALEDDLTPAWLDGDPGRLAQIVANLLENGLRYTPAGGHVAVRVAEDDGSSVLEVSDSGIGIAASDLPHIFKRFWRADKSRSRATGGAGIGLAIVRELVGAHGGSVAVTSEPGAGTTFRVCLPSRPQPEGRRPSIKTEALG